MSYQLLTIKTNSIQKTLLDELHNLETKEALIFCSRVEPFFDLLARNREYFVQVKRVYLMRLFDVPPHASAYNTENIFIDNSYNYDPHDQNFKFGQWMTSIKNKLLPEKTYVIRLIGSTDRPDWSLYPTQPSAPDIGTGALRDGEGLP